MINLKNNRDGRILQLSTHAGGVHTSASASAQPLHNSTLFLRLFLEMSAETLLISAVLWHSQLKSVCVVRTYARM